MNKSRIFITCSRGIDHYLGEEVAQLGLPVLFRNQAGIETEGTVKDAMGLNLYLRTGLRVLFLVAEFTAEDPEELYRNIHAMAWEEIIRIGGYFSITATVDNPTIDNTRYASQKCKDAIVDRFIKRFNRRPDSGPERNRTVLHLHWQGEDCRIYIDTSGEPLPKRGYRKIPYRAPMQETLAAALIKASGWNDSGSFISPMCGSGTLAIEAALLALNRPSAILRDNFGFMHLKSYDAQAWEDLRNMAKAEVKKGLKSKIIATDISPEAIDAAQKNALTAGVEHLIEFSVCDFVDTEVPEGGGVVIMNPEYGERLGEAAELEKVYARIGDFLKRKCLGYTGYVLTGNPELAKKIGLRPGRKMLFFNGPIECRLLEYELYSGSKKNRAE